MISQICGYETETHRPQIDNLVVVTRGRGGKAVKGKGGQIYSDANDLTLGGGHTVQSADHVSQKSTLKTYIPLYTNVTQIHLIR